MKSRNAAEPAARKPGIHRRLYDWVLSWAETPWGGVALFVFSFAESSFFPIPPDPLLMALALGKRVKSFFYAFICTAASVLGGVLGYVIGAFVWDQLQNFCFTYLFTKATFDDVSAWYEEYEFLVVFTAGFTPIPFKVITIAGGVCGINFWIFLLASTVGRAARFYLVAGLIRLFGEPIRTFIDRYFNLLTIAFVVLFIIGFVFFKYVI